VLDLGCEMSLMWELASWGLSVVAREAWLQVLAAPAGWTLSEVSKSRLTSGGRGCLIEFFPVRSLSASSVWYCSRSELRRR